MKIELLVLPGGRCARVYAQAETIEEWYSDRKINISVGQARIIHNNKLPGISFDYEPPSHYDNDYRVTFKSEVRFNQFCQQFINSEFNDPNKYDSYVHNCAHAAFYALQIADIRFSIPTIKWTYFPSVINLKFPSTILSPFYLYQRTKQHKLTTLKLDELDAKKKSLSSKLQNLVMDDAKKAHVEQVIVCVTNNMATNPVNAEHYLGALEATLDFLKSERDEIKKSVYSDRFRMFKTHPNPRGMKEGADIFLFTLFALLIIWLQIAAKYMVGGSNKNDQIIPSALVVIFLGFYLRYFRAIFAREVRKDTDTPLSNSMENLLISSEASFNKPVASTNDDSFVLEVDKHIKTI